MERTSRNTSWTKVAEIEIMYKTKILASERPLVTTSASAFQIFRSTWNEAHIDFVEAFKILLLNRANKGLGLVAVSVGGITGTVADPKVIFGTALKASACGIICCHNHPSEKHKR